MDNYLSIGEATSLDMVGYLESLGYFAQKIRGNDWWYLSPLRNEKTPSFKVARKLNLWYDHGIGKGGTLVDFGVLFYGCTIKEFLQKLSVQPSHNFSFTPPLGVSFNNKSNDEKKLLITSVSPIKSSRFYTYLQLRKIDLELAKQYLDEVSFALHGKEFRALGFRNNSGGYELRNEYFKGSSSPKDVTLIDRHCENISVFEGFFSFLSYLSVVRQMGQQRGEVLKEGQTSFLILNSLAFFERSRILMERHASVYLYLDRDAAGLKASAKALQWTGQYRDSSNFFHGHKDLNDFLTSQQTLQPTLGLKRGIH
jgi:hypothetical protein